MQNTPMWKKVIAFIIDFFVSFFVFGYIVGWLTGNLHSGGFDLNGGPAVLVFVLIILYFVIMNRFLGGTLAKRLLRTPSKRKS